MRIKRMGVSWELLKNILADDNVIPATKVVADGLPADAVACGVQLYDRTIWVDIQSDSYPEIKEGEEIPKFGTCFETMQPNP
jgi:hypothetical protein